MLRVMRKGLSVLKLMLMEEKIKKIINNAEIENCLKQLTSGKSNSYFESYPYFISFFKKNNVIKNTEVLYQGANMVYGWMPTILDTQKKKKDGYRDEKNVLSSIEILGVKINSKDLEIVSAFMNNSIVGGSKLLHFIYPDKYPIWDSKICSVIMNSTNLNSKVKKIENYTNYCMAVRNIINEPPKNLIEFKQGVKNKIKYVRAIELILFLSADIQKT